jgi:murein DD-endopeptidase MepM/ murein hydrolase activator NlpD
MSLPSLSRRGLIAAGAAALASPALAAGTETFQFKGRPVQGGYLIGRCAPRGMVSLNGEAAGRAAADGLFIVGFDRDEEPSALVSVHEDAGRTVQERVAVGRSTYDIQRIDGLPADQVEPTDPALLARIAREAELKAHAFASRDDGAGFRDGFIMPVTATRRSSSFGGQRILNGKPNRPHYGVDLAAPVGTPIIAPAPGLVVLAEPTLQFEGGLTLIDHGQGLIGMFLHQSRQFVKTGERVERGQRIGLVGQTGRATGPHLCWRLKWRTKNMDPSLMVPQA